MLGSVVGRWPYQQVIFSGNAIDIEVEQLANCMLKKSGEQIASVVRFADVLDKMLWHLAQGMLAWFL